MIQYSYSHSWFIVPAMFVYGPFFSGRITQLHVTKPSKHALSATCYLHSKCSQIKRISQLPENNPDAVLLHWLWMGKQRTTRRAEGQAHMRMWLAFLLCYLTVGRDTDIHSFMKALFDIRNILCFVSALVV